MSSVWPRLEPILPRVAKPARYIGGEDGAQTPEHHPDKVAWLLGYPDTYEIGLPNQGLQILYEILNERDDAVAERTYAPWTDLEAELRAHDVPLFSVDSHRPASDFDILAFNLSAELTYTNLLAMVDLAGCPVRAAERGVDDLFIGAGGHCTYNPEPIAPFLDFVVLGDGEEAVGEITAVLAGWKAHRAAGDDVTRLDALVALAGVTGVYVPALYEADHDADGRLLGTHAHPPGGARRGREAHHHRPGGVALPPQPAGAAHRGGPRPAQRRGLPGLHPGLSLLPGRDDHPAGARAPRRPGPHHGRRRPAPHRLRRGGPHLAVHRRLQRHRGRGQRHRRRRRAEATDAARSVPGTRPPDEARGRGPGRRSTAGPGWAGWPATSACRCRRCGSMPSPSASPPRSSGPAAPASPSPPRAARGGCAR